VAFTDDGVGVADDDLMERAFRMSAETGLPLLQHAEVPGHGGVLAPGSVQTRLGVPAYDARAESDMVERDIRLLRKVPGARYHVLHISSRKTLDLIRKAKEEGLAITGETSPHHLYWTCEDIQADNSAFKMNPPLRSAEDRAALRQALRDGVLDFVATDHAPHEPEAKGTDFCCASFGTTGLETFLRVMLYLYKKEELSAERLVEVFSLAPAQFLGVDSKFGRIEEGRTMNAVLVDVHGPDSPITTGDLWSHSKNNCFLGEKLPGTILTVFQGSKIHRWNQEN